MAMTATRIGGGPANADDERKTNSSRKRAHLFFGLPEPSFYNRRKVFIDKHVKTDDLCDPCPFPSKTYKRNNQSKVWKIMSCDPETLHQGWRCAIQTIGKKHNFLELLKS